jgi:hypothetical protein
MNVISFDVGIKNMAFCIFRLEGSQISIKQWNVFNLIESQVESQTCSCLLKPKNKNTPSKICGKKAKFEKNEIFFCEKHAKSSEEFIILEKECSPPSLKKKKYEELIELCKKYKVFSIDNTISFESREQTVIPSTKKGILEKMLDFFDKKSFRLHSVKKVKNANQTDLICIGRKMKEMMDQIPDIQQMTHVIIENQISPIANRMKTIQGMLAQYFIMRCSQHIIIEFISSANKLKDFVKPAIPLDDQTDRQIYKSHKTDGITFCKQFLENNSEFLKWKSALDTTKRDDLADSFLQGIWYLKHKNIITYAENLKINIV